MGISVFLWYCLKKCEAPIFLIFVFVNIAVRVKVVS